MLPAGVSNFYMAKTLSSGNELTCTAVFCCFSLVARCYSDHGHHMTLKEVCEDRGALMDLLPKPEGDYKTKYKEKCRKYNAHLLVSAILVGVTSYQVSIFT